MSRFIGEWLGRRVRLFDFDSPRFTAQCPEPEHDAEIIRGPWPSEKATDDG